MKITVEHEIRPEQICNFFVTCFEGGSNAWLSSVNPEKGLHDPAFLKAKAANSVIWWGIDEFWASSIWEIRFTESEDNGDLGEEHTLRAANFPEKLRFAFFKAPEVFAKVFFHDGDYDADDADQLLQLILLGEVKYG